MAKYNKHNLARMFDRKVVKELTAKNLKTRIDISIYEKATRIALENLDLCQKDILLDLGTGTGANAICVAHQCHQVIGIDISKESLKIAQKKATEMGLKNIIFAYGSFENPCVEINLFSYKINKILMVYSLHHLPDDLKKKSLSRLTGFLGHPGRIVIGDIMFFDDPRKYSQLFEEVGYDEGETDFPSSAKYLKQCLEKLGAKVKVLELNPLVGVITADFR